MTVWSPVLKMLHQSGDELEGTEPANSSLRAIERHLKKDAKAIGGVLATQTVLVSLCVGGAVIALAYLYPPALPFLPEGGGFSVVLGAAMIFGSLAVGTSPATTLAVMSETRAQGPLKNLTLGLVIAKDVSTVTFYLLMLSIALVLTTGKPFELRVLKEIGAAIFPDELWNLPHPHTSPLHASRGN